MVNGFKTDIMPDEWRIAFRPYSPYTADSDMRIINRFVTGEISEEECIECLAYNNKLNQGAITHDKLIANLIWLGYFSAYKSTHELSYSDMVIEAYFKERREDLLEDCI